MSEIDSKSIDHCVATIAGIVARGRDDRRSILQLGYNLGRLSELTGLGREPFWDRWKDLVENWDLAILGALVRELPQVLASTTPPPDAPLPRSLTGTAE